MKKLMTIFGAILFASIILTSCGGKTTGQCKDDVRAYEFGREMETWTVLRGGGSLTDAIGTAKVYDIQRDTDTALQ